MVTCTTPPFRAAVRLNSGVRPHEQQSREMEEVARGRMPRRRESYAEPRHVPGHTRNDLQEPADAAVRLLPRLPKGHLPSSCVDDAAEAR